MFFSRLSCFFLGVAETPSDTDPKKKKKKRDDDPDRKKKKKDKKKKKVRKIYQLPSNYKVDP